MSWDYGGLDPPRMLQAIGAAIRACRERNQGVPSEISLAGREMLREESVAGRGWNDDPIRLAISLGAVYCAAAEDLTMSTGNALDEVGPGWAVPVVARASLEAAGRGFWLTDPSIDIETRAARAWSIKLEGWWWAAKDASSAAWFNEVGPRTLEILSGAQQRGMRFGLPGPRVAPYVGDKTPGYTKAVAALFPAGGSPYRHLSGFAHGGIHSLLDSAVWDDGDYRSQRAASIGVPIDVLVAIACGAAYGVMVYADRYFTWLGWRDSEWRAMYQHLGRNLLTLLNEVSPPQQDE